MSSQTGPWVGLLGVFRACWGLPVRHAGLGVFLGSTLRRARVCRVVRFLGMGIPGLLGSGEFPHRSFRGDELSFTLSHGGGIKRTLGLGLRVLRVVGGVWGFGATPGSLTVGFRLPYPSITILGCGNPVLVCRVVSNKGVFEAGEGGTGFGVSMTLGVLLLGSPPTHVFVQGKLFWPSLGGEDALNDPSRMSIYAAIFGPRVHVESY